MDVKKLKMESNPLSERITENGNTSFKLWLEFEETNPWDNIENDFANIAVDMLDGRCYGINVWTFKFLETVIEQNKVSGDNLNGLYLIPPDLFVKELNRDCIEKIIADLLRNGNLEDLLNNSIFGLKFLEPYWDVMEMEEENSQALIDELKLELHDNHVLKNEVVQLIARKENNDDIILELEDKRIAVVHLTWTSKKELKGYPKTRVYKNKIDFWNKEMKHDILDFKE